MKNVRSIHPGFRTALTIALTATLLAFPGCKFKGKAEVDIKNMTGAVSVEVTAGQEFSAEGVITEEFCERFGHGKTVQVASCDVIATITRKVPNSKGQFEESTTVEKHTLKYEVACIPGTKWKVDCSDPVIVQIPADWQITNAAFKGDNGVRGQLFMTDQIPPAAPDGTAYQAEKGYKLIVLGFPIGTPESRYDIDLEWTFRKPGTYRIKAIFAAAVYTEDPATGKPVVAYLPPAAPQTHDFSRVGSPFFIADVTAARTRSHQLNDQEVAFHQLPDASSRRYVALALDGASTADLNKGSLRLRHNR